MVYQLVKIPVRKKPNSKMQPKPTQTPKSKMIPKNDADVDNEIENNGVKNEEQEEEDEAGMISEGDS